VSKRKKKEPLAVLKPAKEDERPYVSGLRGLAETLLCGVCNRPVTITVSGLICDCPRIKRFLVSFADDRKRFPKQYQTSELDKETAKMIGAKP
jgi:hypothetical protein